MRNSRMPYIFCTVAALLTACSTAAPYNDADGNPIANAHRRTSASRQAKDIGEEEARGYASLAVPFSDISAHVYCKTLRNPGKEEHEACEKQMPLGLHGWVWLFDSHSVLSPKEQETGLAFAAFAREIPEKQLREIIIGFRGTDFTSSHDWRSNLRWFGRFLPGDDQYDVLYRNSRELTDLAIKTSEQKLPRFSKFELYATGHSLGGGLAQLLVYSDDRYAGAVVFDPTPVTGYSTVVEDSRVNCKARVLRVYERHEALQYLRSFLRQFYTLSDNIHEVSMDLLHHHGSPVKNHSMSEFNNKLVLLAGHPGKIETLPGGPDCQCFQVRHSADLGKWPNECRIASSPRTEVR